MSLNRLDQAARSCRKGGRPGASAWASKLPLATKTIILVGLSKLKNFHELFWLPDLVLMESLSLSFRD